MLKDTEYLALREHWVPEHAVICTEQWIESHATLVVVYLDFKEQTCNTLRFFTICGNWNISVDKTIQLRSKQ